MFEEVTFMLVWLQRLVHFAQNLELLAVELHSFSKYTGADPRA